MKDEIKEILDKLETIVGKHTIEVREDGSKIERISAYAVNELRLNNFSSKILLDCITNLQQENERLNKFVDDILNFYKHNRYEEELTENNMFKLVLNQNEMIMTIEEFKGVK